MGIPTDAPWMRPVIDAEVFDFTALEDFDDRRADYAPASTNAKGPNPLEPGSGLANR